MKKKYIISYIEEGVGFWKKKYTKRNFIPFATMEDLSEIQRNISTGKLFTDPRYPKGFLYKIVSYEMDEMTSDEVKMCSGYLERNAS